MNSSDDSDSFQFIGLIRYKYQKKNDFLTKHLFMFIFNGFSQEEIYFFIPRRKNFLFFYSIIIYYHFYN